MDKAVSDIFSFVFWYLWEYKNVVKDFLSRFKVTLWILWWSSSLRHVLLSSSFKCMWNNRLTMRRSIVTALITFRTLRRRVKGFALHWRKGQRLMELGWRPANIFYFCQKTAVVHSFLMLHRKNYISFLYNSCCNFFVVFQTENTSQKIRRQGF